MTDTSKTSACDGEREDVMMQLKTNQGNVAWNTGSFLVTRTLHVGGCL